MGIEIAHAKGLLENEYRVEKFLRKMEIWHIESAVYGHGNRGVDPGSCEVVLVQRA